MDACIRMNTHDPSPKVSIPVSVGFERNELPLSHRVVGAESKDGSSRYPYFAKLHWKTRFN